MPRAVTRTSPPTPPRPKQCLHRVKSSGQSLTEDLGLDSILLTGTCSRSRPPRQGSGGCGDRPTIGVSAGTARGAAAPVRVRQQSVGERQRQGQHVEQQPHRREQCEVDAARATLGMCVGQVERQHRQRRQHYRRVEAHVAKRRVARLRPPLG
eukprot:scaffold54475_cov69-Phaeocystis_antarctica.AAC.7